MKSGLINIVTCIYQNHNLLPDELHEKSGKQSTIDLTVIEVEIGNELKGILTSIAKKYSQFEFDPNNSYSLLRRILPREGEFMEDTSHLKEVIAHICISYGVFEKLIKYLDQIIDRFKRFQKNQKDYFHHYVKIQNTLDALKHLCEEHERYVNEIDDILNDRDRAWHVDLPFPRNMIDLIANAFIDLENGVLSTPLLRSYIEIDSQIILENTVNNLGRESDPTRYKEKKILLQPTMGFSDIMRLLGNFDILDKKDIDIISRIYDYTSRSVHIGSFFDRLTAWYLLFYLQDLKHHSPSIQAFLTNSIEEFVNRGKFKLVSDSDVVSNYSRFQKPKKARLASKPGKD